MGGKTRNIAIQLVFQQCQPRPQGFSLKNGWVAPPIFRGKSPGDEVAAMLQKGLHVFCCVFYRTFTVVDRDFQTEGGPARLSRS